MRALAVVKGQVTADRRSGLCNTVVCSKVDFFVFHRPPDPLDEDVVAPCPFAVQADRNSVVPQQTGELGACELAALDALLNVKLRLGPDGALAIVV